MLKLADILDFSDSLYIVDVEIIGVDQNNYTLTSVRKDKNDIDFSFPVLQTNDFFVIQKNIPTGASIGLVVNGKGILYRQIKQEQEEKICIDKVLPGVNPDDYCMQQYSIPNTTDTILSIIRKEILNSIISLFSGHLVVGVSVGPFIINDLLRLLPCSIKSISYHNLSLFISNNATVGYELGNNDNENNQNINLSDQIFDSNFLPSLSLGFAYLLGENCNFSEVDCISQNIQESGYKKKTIKLLRIFIPVIFILLLASYALFSHYYTKVDDLNSQIIVNEQMLNHLDEMKQTYASKNKFLEQSGLLSETKYAYYLDIFAQQVPSSIVLNDITINPQIKKTSLSMEVTFEKGLMMVTGVSHDSFEFNNWIKGLKATSDFKEVSIIKYEFKEAESQAYFSIKVQL